MSDLIKITTNMQVDQTGLQELLKAQLDEIMRVNQRLDENTQILQDRINELEQRVNNINESLASFKEETLDNERSLFQKILDIFPKNKSEKRLKETIVRL